MSRRAGGFSRSRGGSCQSDPHLLNVRGRTCKRNSIFDNTFTLSGSPKGPFADMSGGSCRSETAFVYRSVGSLQPLARRAVAEYTPLELYMRLCRHLTLDPEATAAYVHANRDMWDADGEAWA